MVQKIHPRGVIWVPSYRLMWADQLKTIDSSSVHILRSPWGTHQIIYMSPNIPVSLLGCRHHGTYCSQCQERVEKFSNYPSQQPPNYFPMVRKSGLELNVQFLSTDVVFAQQKTSWTVYSGFVSDLKYFVRLEDT